MAFNIFATATSDIPLANLDANFTMIGSSAVASTLYPTASTSITYGTAGTIHYFSGSGLAVTGTLSSTGDATLCKTSGNITAGYATSGGTLKLDIYDGSLTSTTIGANRVARIGSNVNGGDCTLQFTDSVTYNSYISAKANHLYIQPATAGTYVADFSSTGLAVTGTLSANTSISTNGGMGWNEIAIRSWTMTTATTSGSLSINSGDSLGSLKVNVPLAVTGTLSATGDSAFGASSTAGFRLYAKGASATSSDFALVIQNSTPTSLLTVRNDGQLGFGVSATAMILDTSGNLGLGVTPSAWSSGFSAFQFSTTGTVWSNGGNANIGSNHYFNGSNYIYKTTDYASRLQQINGQFQFYTAPSGTAGNAITFTQAMTLDASGNLMVGITTPTNLITAGPVAGKGGLFGSASSAGSPGVQGAHTSNSATGYVAYFANSGSSTGLYISNTAAWQSTSDERLKEDVKDIDSTERILNLRPVDYLWKTQATSDNPTKRNFGFIAQELQQVFPDLVGVSPDGMLSVEYTGLIAPLVKAIQELSAKVAALEAK